ncbi:MAG TPA: KGG domain-containing protein, partial [Myxococcales bacterium]|nr:KGG domain-containing protein [Myxococcales bacterium]
RVRDERGVEFYQEIGRKGGELGGRKGGEAVRDKYGPSFYEEIGRKGGQKVRELIEQGKKRIL